jgi:hypothetical protein
MCGGAKYTDKAGKKWTIYFPSPKAALPVLKRDGDVEWVFWGKRKEEPLQGFVKGGVGKAGLHPVRQVGAFPPLPMVDSYNEAVCCEVVCPVH